MEGVCLQRRNRTVSKGYDVLDSDIHSVPGRCGLDAILNAAAELPLSSSSAARSSRGREDGHENEGHPLKK